MAAVLVSVAQFRSWAGASIAAVPDALIQDCLNEAEAGIVASLGVGVAEIQSVAEAEATAIGEEKRRAQRLLARRNSPEGVAGAGEMGMIVVPTRDPDSARAIEDIRYLLDISPALA